MPKKKMTLKEFSERYECCCYGTADTEEIIVSSCFFGCTNLTDVELSEGINSICYGAFKNCTGLKSVTIPKSVTHIEGTAFGYKYTSGNEDVKLDEFKIYCYSGTAGEQYAIDNGFDYELLDNQSGDNSESNSEVNSSESENNSHNISDVSDVNSSVADDKTTSSQNPDENLTAVKTSSSSAAKTNSSSSTNPNTGAAAGMAAVVLGLGAAVVTKRRK